MAAQTAADPDLATRRHQLFAGLLGLDAALICVIPRATIPLLLITAIAALISTGQRAAIIRSISLENSVVIAVVALLAYLAFNASWAIDPHAGYAKLLALASIVAMAFVAGVGICRLTETALDLAAKLFVAGAIFGAAFLMIEAASDQAFTRIAYNLLPVIRPDSVKDLHIVDDRVTDIAHAELNRNVALLVLYMWPAAFILRRSTEFRWRNFLVVGLVLMTAIAVVFSQHETSKIALAASVAVGLLSLSWPHAVRRCLAAVWCLAFIAAIPMAFLAYQKAELHKADWLPRSAQARIIIWNTTAEQVMKNPVFGIGIRSTRKLNEANKMTAEWPDGHVIAKVLGRHAHNIFLQAWLELGLIGAALIMACGLVVFRSMAHLPDAVQPVANAVFTAFAVIASFAWGMWQTWLMAAFAFALLFMVLANQFAARRDKLGATNCRLAQ